MAQYLTDPVHRCATSLLSCLSHRKCYIFKHVDGKGGSFRDCLLSKVHIALVFMLLSS